MHLVRTQDVRVNHSSNGAGVMNGRGRETEFPVVRIAKEAEQVGGEGRDRAMNRAQAVKHLRRCQRLVRDFKRGDGDRATGSEDNGGSFRVGPDIEFCRWRFVANTNCAAHERNGLDTRNDIRFAAHRHRDIGQRPGRHQRNIAIRVHQKINDEIDAAYLYRLNIRFGNIWPVKARFAVNFGRETWRPHKRTLHAPGYRYIPNIRQRTDLQRIARRLLHRLIARYSGDGLQRNIGMVGSQEYSNCIIMSRVAVNDDFTWHRCSSLYLLACARAIISSTTAVLASA